MKSRSQLVLLLMVGGVLSCQAPSGEPVLFVAASLSDVAQGWQEALGSDSSFDYHAGASLLLSGQIAAGAEAALFLPAGLSALGRLPSDRIARIDSQYLHNRLVLVVAPGVERPSQWTDLQQPRFRRIAVADPELSPAGHYARDGLRSAGLWQSLQPRLLFTGDVRMASETVRLGSADAGLVYATEVTDWNPNQVMALDSLIFPLAQYPLVMLAPETASLPRGCGNTCNRLPALKSHGVTVFASGYDYITVAAITDRRLGRRGAGCAAGTLARVPPGATSHTGGGRGGDRRNAATGPAAGSFGFRTATFAFARVPGWIGPDKRTRSTHPVHAVCSHAGGCGGIVPPACCAESAWGSPRCLRSTKRWPPR